MQIHYSLNRSGITLFNNRKSKVINSIGLERKMILNRILLITATCSLNILSSISSVLPADKSLIHYTTVYFEEDFLKGAKNYNLVLSSDSLFKNIITLKNFVKNELPAFWVPDLEWGHIYYWKVDAFAQNGAVVKQGKLHRFKITEIMTGNFDDVKLTINTNKPGKQSGGFIAIDNARTIYDRNGKAVWTLPKIPGLIDDWVQTRDLKMTKDNTLTLLVKQTPVEIDFEGNVLWKGPDPFVLNKDTIVFHHDLKKDGEGNYYVLGNKFVYRKLLVKLPQDVITNEDMVRITDTAVYRKTEIGVLLKFDKSNRLLWYYDLGSYLQDIDLNYKKSASGFPNFNSHANAFSINGQGTMAYIGLRDLSRIIKINIKTKAVIATYGEKYPSGEAQFCNNLFRSQHDAHVTGHNSILVFNNNSLRSGGVSSVVEFRDSFGAKDSSLLWKLELDFDTLTKGKSMKGGNVLELANSNLFVCAGELNRIFEVTRSKEIVWDAFIWLRTKQDTLWKPFPQYRASLLGSLIKHHFMIRLEDVKKNKNTVSVNYSIYNTGNYSDNYIIEIIDENNTVLKAQRTGRINYNGSFKSSIQYSKSDKYSGNLYLRITSVGNSALVEKVMTI